MSPNEHLSRIETLWSVVRQAHAEDGSETTEARARLIERYGGAIRRYLMASLRDEDAVDEVFQEFSLRFVKGDFRNVCPEKGRFRFFLKTVIYHLIADYGRRRKRFQAAALQHESLLADQPDDSTPEADLQFHATWRDHLLADAWERLQSEETENGKPFYTILRCRADQPDLRSPELARHISTQLGREMTAGNLRVQIHRARERFAELLIISVRESLESDDGEILENELIDLNLWAYCKPMLKPDDE
ncbi:MAG: sigma-70 family RNA polymerase sigma factor [Planctomycetaceae bacterium]|nr:sigma-70 family RNA polymerase sigma factor [Planctomycetaceae bacterium]